MGLVGETATVAGSRLVSGVRRQGESFEGVKSAAGEGRSTVTDPREYRLPKWAQEELAGLRRSLEVERKRNAELRADVGETNISVQNYGSNDQPIVKGASIRFQLGDRFDQYITVRAEDDGRLSLHGGRFLIIHPHVSNAFYVVPGGR